MDMSGNTFGLMQDHVPRGLKNSESEDCPVSDTPFIAVKAEVFIENEESVDEEDYEEGETIDNDPLCSDYKRGVPKTEEDDSTDLFVTNANRRKHTRVHTGEKRFECLECGKKFSASSSLKIHRQSLSCLVCDAAFSCRSRLTVHQRGHNDIGLYTCTTCGLPFTKPSLLYKHRNSHIEEERPHNEVQQEEEEEEVKNAGDHCQDQTLEKNAPLDFTLVNSSKPNHAVEKT